MSDRIHCLSCDGSGRAPLGVELQRTLDVCRRIAGDDVVITAPLVRSELRLEHGEIARPTTINNRLTWLANLGFLERDGRQGRRIAWRLREVPR